MIGNTKSEQKDQEAMGPLTGFDSGSFGGLLGSALGSLV